MTHFTVSGSEYEIPALNVQVLRTSEGKPDGGWVRSRGQTEVVLHFLTIAMEHQIDSRIHALVPDATIKRDSRNPGVSTAYKVVCSSRLWTVSAQANRRRDVPQLHSHNRLSIDRRHTAAVELQYISRRPRHEGDARF